MPIEWGVIIAAAALIAITIVAVYTLSALKEWITNRLGVYRNRQIIAGALRDRLESGNYKVVPFVYNITDNEIIDTDNIEADELDAELMNKFASYDEFILEVRE